MCTNGILRGRKSGGLASLAMAHRCYTACPSCRIANPIISKLYGAQGGHPPEGESAEEDLHHDDL